MTRSEVSEERRMAIVAAATRVLAREGITETTTRKIATEAGVNQAMIGYYFGGKDELLHAVLLDLMRRTSEIAGSSLPREASFAEALTGAIEAFWAHVEEAPELEVMQYELTLYALRNPASAWLAKSQYAGYCDVVAGLIERVCAMTGERTAKPPDALTRFIVAGLDGLILQYVSDRDGERARGDLRRLAAAALALARGVDEKEA